jgi:hypothetical protein
MKTFLYALPIIIPAIAMSALIIFGTAIHIYRKYQYKKDEEKLLKEGFKWFDPNKPFDQQ